MTTLPPSLALDLVEDAALAVYRAHDGLQARCDAARDAGIPEHTIQARIDEAAHHAVRDGTHTTGVADAVHHLTTTTPTGTS